MAWSVPKQPLPKSHDKIFMKVLGPFAGGARTNHKRAVTMPYGPAGLVHLLDLESFASQLSHPS